MVAVEMVVTQNNGYCIQFPNGQLTYVAGEGLSTSAFLPVFGGLLQAQGQYPGEMRFSFSCKNNWGTRITPMVQWPERSFTIGLEQDLPWKRSGLMVKPTVQFSLHPTFGGNNPGLKNEDLNLIGGCSLTSHPSAFASLSVVSLKALEAREDPSALPKGQTINVGSKEDANKKVGCCSA